jgi:hypothetical protein
VSETFTVQRICLDCQQLFVYTACYVLCSYSAYNDNGKKKKTYAVKSKTPEQKEYSCFEKGFELALEGHKHVMFGTLQKH